MNRATYMQSKIDANVAAMLSGAIDYDTFRAEQARLWAAIEAAPAVEEQVLSGIRSRMNGRK